MSTVKKNSQVVFADMNDIFNTTTTENTQNVPKVEELHITNDVSKRKGRSSVKQEPAEEQKKEEESPKVPVDPRPKFTSAPVFKYIIVGLVITAIVIALIYVVRTYFWKPVPEVDARDETIRSMNDEILKLKNQEEEISRVVSQLRRENQMKDQLLADIKEQKRFENETMNETSYTLDEPTAEKIITEKDKFKEFMGVKSENVPENEEAEEDVEEDVEEYEEDEDEGAEITNDVNGTFDMTAAIDKSEKEKKKNKSVEVVNVDDEDIMKLVSST